MLDHDVHALFVGDFPHFLRDLLLVVIDAVVGAQCARFLELRLVSRGRDHAGMKQLGNLNGGDAHARTRAQNQHGLTQAECPPGRPACAKQSGTPVERWRPG